MFRGGSLSEDSICKTNHYGFLCQNCVENFAKYYIYGPCKECLEFFNAAFGMLFYYLLLIFFYFLFYSGAQE